MRKSGLQKNSQSLIDFFESSSMPFFFVTTGEERWFFNEAFCRLVGYSEKELYSMERTRLIPQEWLGSVMEKHALLTETGVPQVIEQEYIRKDGKRVPVEVHLHMKNEKGENFYYALVADITERKRMEKQQLEAMEEKRVSEEKFSRAFKHLPNMVCITSPDGTYLDISDAFSEILGYSREDVIGKNAGDYGWYNQEDRITFVSGLQQNGFVRDLEFPFQRKTGEIITALISAVNIQIDGNDYILTSLNDITKRKKAEEALRSSEEKFNKAFFSLPITMGITTLDGVYVEVNSAASEIMGYTRGEIIGRNSADFLWIDPKDREVFAAALGRYGFIHEMEFNLRHKSGEVVNTLVSAVQIEIEGTSYYVTTLNDITKRKKVEKALQDNLILVRSILSSVPHGLFGVENFNIFFANNAMEDVFGWKPEEVIGKSTSILFRNKREWEEYGEMLFSQLESRHVVNFESTIPFIRKDGREILCRTSIAWVGGQEGKSRRGKIIATLEDITERKRAEEALAASEERYRVLFEQSREAMIIFETDTWQFTSANPAIREMFGVDTLEDFLDMGHQTISPERQPDGRLSTEVASEMIETALRQGSHFFEWIHRRLNGEEFPSTVLLSRIMLGDRVLMQATVRDISDLKKAEMALRESEERYRKFINTTSDIVFVKDENHRYIIVNPELAAFFGRPAEEIVGKTDFDLMDYDAAGQCKESDLKVKELSTVIISEEPIGDRVYETHKFPLELSSGKTGVGGFIRDVTERKRAEQMLQDAHEKLSRSYDRLREVNDELETKVAERTQELLAVNEELQAINAELIGANIALENQIESRKKVEERLANTNQELADALMELKEAQSQLVQAEKMASLGTLVAGVAHEINSPVGVGVTAASHLGKITHEFSRLLENGHIHRKDVDAYIEDIQTAVDIVQSNLERAAKQIRSFKQVSADQSSEERRSFNVREYIDAILTSLQPELKKTKHTVSVNCDENIRINSYPGAFSQILTNLLINSIMHAYDPGEAGRITVGIQPVGQNLLLTYSDDGRGMEKQVLQKIFDPFFTTKRGAGGTGLGLYIVFNLVNQVFNGSVDCASNPGQGTTFSIQLKL